MTRHLLVAVAVIALGLSLVRGYNFCFATRFVWGFEETQFDRVRIGMTYKEVESIVGLPLRNDSTSPRWPGTDNWMYSEPAFLTNDEDRRWVMFRDGVVSCICDGFVPD
jgi:hypothetical protein